MFANNVELLDALLVQDKMIVQLAKTDTFYNQIKALLLAVYLIQAFYSMINVFRNVQ